MQCAFVNKENFARNKFEIKRTNIEVAVKVQNSKLKLKKGERLSKSSQP